MKIISKEKKIAFSHTPPSIFLFCYHSFINAFLHLYRAK